MAAQIRHTALFVFSCLVGLIAVFWGAGELQGDAPESANPYDRISVRDGLYKDGQAAPWDLPWLDQFKIFGAPERARGYVPTQPIAFSHVRHVQQNKMECQYCHWSVAKAAFAAIPEVESCIGCHKFMPGGSDGNKANATAQEKAQAEIDKKEVAKIAQYFNKGEAIPWVKVHVMPDHVRFNHKRHVKAGVGCQECHGQVPMMPVVERMTSMKMGWCIDCHRERGASIDCATCHK